MRGDKRLICVCVALLLGAFVSASVASAKTIYVPDDYAKIQWAVDNASAGDKPWEKYFAPKNQPPVANFTYSPERPIANQTVTFDASSSYDSDGTILSYEWDFEDGNITNTTEETINTAPECVSCSNASPLSLVQSNWSTKPVIVNIQINLESKEDQKYIHNILSRIESHGWITSVFVTGEFASEHPEVVREIERRGHYIGVYGWKDEDLSLLSYIEQLNLINKSISAVRSVVSNPKYVVDFKPQNLKYNDDTIKALQDLEMKSITATFSANESFVKCPYAKSVGKVTFPYPITTDFAAVPISDVKIGSEEILLEDKEVFSKLTAHDYLNYLKEEFDKHNETKDPMVIVINPSVTGADETKLHVLSQFLDYVDEKGGKVKPTAPITVLTTYIPYLKIISAPQCASPGETVTVTVAFTAAIYCPSYYFRIYGKYPSESGWRLHAEHYHGVQTGTFSFSRSFTIPQSPCNEKSYTIRVVGQGCSGTCWPTPCGYENIDEVTIKVKDPTIRKYRGVELKPGDLLFKEKQLYPWIPAFMFGHVGIYIGNGQVVEALGDGVQIRDINKFSDWWHWIGATTVIGYENLPPCKEKEIRDRVVELAKSYKNTPYNWNYFDYKRTDKVYCSQLVYLVYKEVGYNLYRWWFPHAIPPKFLMLITKPLDATTYSIDPPAEEIGMPKYIKINKIYPNSTILHSIPIDPTVSEVIFGINWPPTGSDLNLTLYKPDGTVVNDTNITHEKNIEYAYEFYTIQNPVPGNWTMNITAIDVPPEGENYTIMAYLITNLTLSLSTDKYLYDASETVNIAANLTNISIPFIGANVTAEIYEPGGSVHNITLYDDGSHGDNQANDGIYSNIYANLSGEGIYDIIAYASGTILDYHFFREAVTSIIVRNQTAIFTNNYSDFGTDKDGDGLYNYLTLYAEINVSTAGNYTLEGLLFDSNRTEIELRSNYTYLNSGISVVELNFDGFGIYEHGVDGPYNLSLGLYDENGIKMDYRQYTTSPYNYTDFQRGGQIRGFVTDTNGTPVYNAYVSACGPSFGSAATDINGSYMISGLLSGSYNVTVSTPPEYNMLDASATVNVAIDETTFANFTLQYGGVITGTVTDYNGDPVPDAYILAIGPTTTSTITDINGTYRITRLESGSYTIRVEPLNPNLMTASDYAYLTAGQTIVRNFTLQAAGSIAGNITDVNGTGIPNIIVYLSGYETARYRTDESGYYVIPRLQAGTYTVNVDASETGFEDNSTTVVVTLGQTTIADFVLKEFQGGSIAGRVTDMNGTGVSNARVVASGPSYRESYTNETGYYEIRGLLAGEYTVTAYPPYGMNLVSNSTTASVTLGETTVVNLILREGGIIAGRVTYENGTGIYDAYVEAYNWTFGMVEYDYTNETGYYEIAGLEAGNYTVTAYPPYGMNLVSNSTTASVTLGETTVVNLILREGGIIAGRVTYENGTGIYDAYVEAYNWTFGMVEYDYTNETGYYEIAGLEAGNYTVTAYPPYGMNLVSNSTTASVTLGETTVVNLILREVAEPSVSISTDKYEYAAGDTMLINITLANPTGEWRHVRFLWRLDFPDYGLQFSIISTMLWLPPLYERTFTLRWRLPAWRLSFDASWYVALFDAETSELISEDRADWRYTAR